MPASCQRAPAIQISFRQHGNSGYDVHPLRFTWIRAGRKDAVMPKLRRHSLAMLVAVTLDLWPRSAETCGMFVAAPRERVPSLSAEQTLIVFDPANETEHFIRQVAIRNPSAGFGFVVPVPEQPEVAAIKQSPFEKLARAYPVRPRDRVGGGGLGGGVSAGARPGGVTVLSQERVGSFTAFVLAATDAGGLKKWLDEHQLATTPQAEAWFAHYVKLGFYYAALRYEQPTPPEAASQGSVTRAETLRITFRSALPYYPYREPQHAAAGSELRDLAVWLISPSSYVPVSLQEDDKGAVWKRPLKRHSTQEVARDALETVVGPEVAALLPGADRTAPDGTAPRLVVEVFEDQKRSREGWGDVVMVPSEPRSLPAWSLVLARKLMASIDPAFGGEP